MKRNKTKDLRIDQEHVLQPSDLPPGAVLEGYRDVVVQDLVFKSNNTRYRRAVYRLPDGTLRVAERPDDVNSHFGFGLRQNILLQVHQNHVTQNRLLEQLRDTGIDISAGQISNILLAGHDAFLNERKIDRLIPLTVAHRLASSYHTSFLSRGPLPACRLSIYYGVCQLALEGWRWPRYTNAITGGVVVLCTATASDNEIC